MKKLKLLKALDVFSLFAALPVAALSFVTMGAIFAGGGTQMFTTN